MLKPPGAIDQNRHLAPSKAHDLLCRLVTQVPYAAQHLAENIGDPRIDVDSNWILGIHGNSPAIFNDSHSRNSLGIHYQWIGFLGRV
jgi:hypothetical protein